MNHVIGPGKGVSPSRVLFEYGIYFLLQYIDLQIGSESLKSALCINLHLPLLLVKPLIVDPKGIILGIQFQLRLSWLS